MSSHNIHINSDDLLKIFINDDMALGRIIDAVNAGKDARINSTRMRQDIVVSFDETSEDGKATEGSIVDITLEKASESRGKFRLRVHERQDEDKFIPYKLMQYYDTVDKEWQPILVEVNVSDDGWWYDGVAYQDSLGHIGYEDFTHAFINNKCKNGTDKCDAESVEALEKVYLDGFKPEDEYQPRKVSKLGAFVPAGLSYIGK